MEKGQVCLCSNTLGICGAEEDRVSDFELKLMDIDSEHLGIPDTDYAANITMPASEYQRICKDLSSIGDTGKSCFSQYPVYSRAVQQPVLAYVVVVCHP